MFVRDRAFYRSFTEQVALYPCFIPHANIPSDFYVLQVYNRKGLIQFMRTQLVWVCYQEDDSRKTACMRTCIFLKLVPHSNLVELWDDERRKFRIDINSVTHLFPVDTMLNWCMSEEARDLMDLQVASIYLYLFTHRSTN